MYLKRGFTVAELMLTIAIGSILMTLATMNLFGSKARTSLSTTVDILMTDLNHQQLKAMVGDSTLSSNPQSYGIRFNQNTYELFRDVSYSSSDGHNFTVNLGDNISFNQTTFPDSQLIFATLSGELLGFNPSSNSVIIRDQITGEQKTIVINRFGVISEIN
ncbi:hypothetical protein A3C23_01450 [Candidatus Roizmanbacteria bacterium RIFCSPHIGHO2_02_FULL_37_13b]|uniref:General secretion pathway GspH domain-containing protein n=1 Tax=Candidatus Roizmanbacteria bacterium RIFCSPLOWO2_02_FULL_36_11 TaxID=1802071 RepID=A0A1F7JIF8_9BACT|nr:MAG: hypothetical protein A3C23_01450 [Candidatus Roizmanbacteria bacterium RIFCSPHIGHO2_02_FULL_37_13b]OGK55403.1 MAG: hypothetical protein A3H78_05920 [Candidatus Roizmanbacteria bacterium RIFCSPLOWO2_02_FULL_36_11]